MDVPMHGWHPLLVHFPLGLLLGGTAVEAAGWLTRRPALRRAGLSLLLAGVLLALPAVASGLFAYGRVDHSDASHALMTLHRNLMLAGVSLFAVAVIWRWRAGERVAVTSLGAITYATLLATASTMLILGADRGAALVYWHATGLSSERLERVLRERRTEHVHGSGANEARPAPGPSTSSGPPPHAGDSSSPADSTRESEDHPHGETPHTH